ncbi:MAG: 4Fe-4S binding protein [Coriobacteriales bacterium]|nr:4Fe-4S binding protein [Coriobacteriales bacterium]
MCVSVCEEQLDPHFPGGMHECTKCGLCRENCPAKAITIPVFAGKAKKQNELQT